MGKRELLLIVAFVIVGAVVYQVTAPPPAPGERSFSLGRVIESIRREVRGNRASAEKTTTSTHPVDTGVTELRATGRFEITVTGEDRADIAADLQVHSNGYDEAEAHKLAGETVLKMERAGSRLTASVSFPEPGSQRAKLRLKIPSRLLVTLESGARLNVSNVAGVELNSRGDIEIRNVAGRVTGTHRGGTIAIMDCGSIKATTVNSDVQLERIKNEVSLNTRGGDMKGSELAGPIDIDSTGTDVVLEKLEKTAGLVRIHAVQGSVTVKGLRTEGRIDVREADVDVVVDRAAPLAIYSEGGDSVDVTPPDGGYQLDAVAMNADVTVAGDAVRVVKTGEEHRATGAVKGGGPTITIRTGRGSITVRAR